MGYFDSGQAEGGVLSGYARLSPHGSDRLSIVRAVQRTRLRRDKMFASGLFSDPAWDMLLELYAAHLEQRRIAIGELCRASRVALTTVLRWLDAFQREGLVERKPDPLDSRRAYVSLSLGGVGAMSAYFATVPSVCDQFHRAIEQRLDR